MIGNRSALLTAAAATAALLAFAIMAPVFATVLWRIATNADGSTGDYISFYAAGWLVRGSHAGLLYDPATLDWAQHLLYPGHFDEAIGYPLPVFVAWVFAPFSLLPFTASFFLWMALNAVLLGGVLLLLDARVLHDAPSRVRIAFALVAGLSMPAIATLVFGQVDVIVLAGLAGGYLALRAKRPGLAALPLGLVLVKPHFLIGVGFYLLASRQWKTIGVLAAIGLPLLIVPALLTAPETLAGNARILSSYPGADSNLMVNAEMMANWRGFIVSATNHNDLLLWLPGLATIAIAAVAVAWPRWTSGDFDRAYSLAVALPLLASPHLHTQSLLLLALPGALMLRAFVAPNASAERQQTAITWLLGFYAALFFLPFFAIQGLSLTVFLLIGTYATFAFRWPAGDVAALASPATSPQAAPALGQRAA